MADNRIYERLFCCECGNEVLAGEAGRIMPPLQPGGKGVGGSTRPHVWCTRCWAKEVEETEARPKPHELLTPAFELHRHIFAIGEGRTDEELVSFHRACAWPEKLSTLLRELTEEGKIEKRGDRRVALCAPWAQPPSSATEEVPADYASTPPGAMPAPTTTVDAVRSSRRHRRPTDEEIDDAFAPLPKFTNPEDDVTMRDADEALPDEDELQADRYFSDVSVIVLQEVNARLKNIEALLNHLVEADVGRRLKWIERCLLKLARGVMVVDEPKP